MSSELLDDFDSPVSARIYELLAPVVATADAELLDVEWTGGTLRLVVGPPDDEEGAVQPAADSDTDSDTDSESQSESDSDPLPRGVNTNSLATVNRLVSPILDQHDPISGRYTLEVSSPGVERPLRRLDHYRRAVGENVIIKMISSVEPRRVRGALHSVDEHAVVIDVVEVDGVDLNEAEQRTLVMADISTARTIFDWGPTPKVGGKNPKKSKNTKNAKNTKNKNAKKKTERASNSSAARPANTTESINTGNEVGDE